MRYAAYVNWFPHIDYGRAIVQTGVIRLVGPEPNHPDERWGSKFQFASDVLPKSGTEIRLYDYRNLAARKQSACTGSLP
jgi:deoxycytidylate deaminase